MASLRLREISISLIFLLSTEKKLADNSNEHKEESHKDSADHFPGPDRAEDAVAREQETPERAKSMGPKVHMGPLGYDRSRP